MMQLGLQEEAFGLHPYRGLRSLETVGYQELFDFFENKTDLKSVVELIKQNSRRYAKRQMTWFRKYGEWTNFDQGRSEQIKAFIEEQLSKRHKSS
jgi:tRNA dimethylallyltransferase